MNAINQINAKYGRGTIMLDQDRACQAWGMRQEKKSPDYTMDWNQLPSCV
ncbi:MAG: DUF4113 domain-containing protein [Burkholderiaceae bacterium]